jgi:hypothetical protein
MMAADREEIDRTFAVDSHSELSLTNVTGSTDVRVWDLPVIRVVATKRPGGTIPFAPVAEGYQATQILMEQQGHTVTVKTRTDYQGVWSFLRWLGGVAVVDYLAYVPVDCSVVVSQATGSLSVQGLQRSLVVKTVSAAVSVQDIAGSVALSTVSGRVTCESIRGRLAVKGVTSRVTVVRSNVLSLSAKTVAGNIELRLVPGSGVSYELETVSGDAQISVPAGMQLSARLDSMGGRMESELQETPVEVENGHWRCDINGGGGSRLHMRTVGGVLRLLPPLPPTQTTQAADVKAPPATTRSQPEPASVGKINDEPVDRETVMKLILRAVEQGSLTVEQAAEKLAQLEQAAAEEEATGASPTEESDDSAGGERGNGR